MDKKQHWDGKHVRNPDKTQDIPYEKYVRPYSSKPIDEVEKIGDYTDLTNEQLEDRFYNVRERMRSDVLMNIHDQISKSDYKNYYLPLLQEIEKRGLSVAQPDHQVENISLGTEEEYEEFVSAIMQPIESSIQKESPNLNLEMLKKLLSDRSLLIEAQNKARETYRLMDKGVDENIRTEIERSMNEAEQAVRKNEQMLDRYEVQDIDQQKPYFTPEGYEDLESTYTLEQLRQMPLIDLEYLERECFNDSLADDIDREIIFVELSQREEERNRLAQLKSDARSLFQQMIRIPKNDPDQKTYRDEIQAQWNDAKRAVVDFEKNGPKILAAELEQQEVVGVSVDSPEAEKPDTQSQAS